MLNILFYTAPACPYCVIIKRFLDKNSIPYTEIDISKNEAKRKEMISKSEQENVPVLDISGKIIVGYNLQKLKEALKLS